MLHKTGLNYLSIYVHLANGSKYCKSFVGGLLTSVTGVYVQYFPQPVPCGMRCACTSLDGTHSQLLI